MEIYQVLEVVRWPNYVLALVLAETLRDHLWVQMLSALLR
jgi:hypothetical protein